MIMEQKAFFISVCAESFSLNRDLHSTVILPLSFISIIITHWTMSSDFLMLRSSLILSIKET